MDSNVKNIKPQLQKKSAICSKANGANIDYEKSLFYRSLVDPM